MKGFVPTPEAIVDLMVDKLFEGRHPTASSRILDPGCGRGAFIQGILRWCHSRQIEPPTIVGVDLNPSHVYYCRELFRGFAQIEIAQGDFLDRVCPSFDFVVGNPPYVSLGALSADERTRYRGAYQTATGRFDLYLLFFERALRLLSRSGRLVFITPEKYCYVESARPLRRLLSQWRVEELHFLTEDTFAGLITYPLVTTITGDGGGGTVRVIDRTGPTRCIQLPVGEASWIPAIRGASVSSGMVRLEDAALRVSCGVATGADSVFIVRTSELDPALQRFARPTLSGREITSTQLPHLKWSLLLPYDSSGLLIPEAKLGALGVFLKHDERRKLLERRYCVASKPWYAFHETPPLTTILRPKILCKDIGAEPLFVVDHQGAIVPRHSTYYIVPANPTQLDELAEYLNSDDARVWLLNHCQRAASGFIRVQSHVLKRLPLPSSLSRLAPMLPFETETALSPHDNSLR